MIFLVIHQICARKLEFHEIRHRISLQGWTHQNEDSIPPIRVREFRDDIGGVRLVSERVSTSVPKTDPGPRYSLKTSGKDARDLRRKLYLYVYMISCTC